MVLDRPILALALAQTIVWAGGYYSFPALLLFWERDLGWSKTDLTAAFTMTVLVSAIFSPFAGRLIDRGFGPLLLSGAILATGLLVAALAFSESYLVFFGLWTLIGVALAGALYEPCFALVTRSRGPAARRSITLITLLAGFAGTLSFPLGDVLSQMVSWRAACLTFGALICLLAAPLAFYGGRQLERTRVPEPEPAAGEPRQLSYAFLSRPAFWALGFAFAAIAFNHGSIINHIRPLLDERGVPADAAVLAASMVGPMQVFGRLAMMTLERVLPNSVMTAYCFLGLCIASLILLGAGGIPGLLVAFVILQGSAYGITSIMKPVITRDILGQRNFGVINGALALPFLVAMALAPVAASLLWEVGGYDLMLWCAFMVAFIGFVCFLVALKIHAGE